MLTGVEVIKWILPVTKFIPPLMRYLSPPQIEILSESIYGKFENSDGPFAARLKIKIMHTTDKPSQLRSLTLQCGSTWHNIKPYQSTILTMWSGNRQHTFRYDVSQNIEEPLLIPALNSIEKFAVFVLPELQEWPIDSQLILKVSFSSQISRKVNFTLGELS
jgi:hypothetical protein